MGSDFDLHPGTLSAARRDVSVAITLCVQGTKVCKWLKAVALQVFKMAYCNQYRPDEKRQLDQKCVDFVLRVCQDLLTSTPALGTVHGVVWTHISFQYRKVCKWIL